MRQPHLDKSLDGPVGLLEKIFPSPDKGMRRTHAVDRDGDTRWLGQRQFFDLLLILPVAVGEHFQDESQG